MSPVQVQSHLQANGKSAFGKGCHFSELFPHRFFITFPPPPVAGGFTRFYRVRVGVATPFALPGALAARRLGPSMTI